MLHVIRASRCRSGALCLVVAARAEVRRHCAHLYLLDGSPLSHIVLVLRLLTLLLSEHWAFLQARVRFRACETGSAGGKVTASVHLFLFDFKTGVVP